MLVDNPNDEFSVATGEAVAGNAEGGVAAEGGSVG